MEQPEEQRSKLGRNNPPHKTTTVLGWRNQKKSKKRTKHWCRAEYALEKIQAQTDGVMEHHQELKQRTMAA